MSKKSAKAKSPKETPSYEIKDIVLGKVRGYPPWPGMVVDPETVPPAVQKDRPGGKKNTFYCVRFFPTGDYSWLVSKDISKLQKHEIESYVNDPHKKSTDLLAGYRIALDPEPWEKEKKKLAEELEAQHEESSEENDQDQLASESENSSTSKKRKRGSQKAPAKKGGKKSGKKSKATVESEDDGEGEEDEEVPSKPPTKKAKTTKGAASNAKGTKAKSAKDKDDEGDEEPADPEAVKVRDWRHKLQKTFLSSNKPDIKAEDMPAMDELFTQIENYDRMTIECLSFSKIGKVMRHIASLKDNKIPSSSETQFHFRERARGLMEKWHVILNSSGDAATTSSAAAPVVNGEALNGTGEMNIGDISVMSALPDITMEA